MKIKANYFRGTVWVTDNRDSFFFKSDTIKIVRIMNSSFSKSKDSKDVAKYFDKNDFITMEFSKTNKLNLFVTKVNTWSIVKKKGQYKWKLNCRKRTLQLYFEDKMFACFTPMSLEKVQIESEYIGNSPATTIEVMMRRKQIK